MKTPLAIRNNNPLNIRFSPMNNWTGQTGSNRGFCTFDTLEHGFRAAIVLLCNYQRKGYDTIAKIIERWAPRTENNTKAYISAIDSRSVFLYDSDFNPNTARIENISQIFSLCLEMAKVEIGRVYYDSHPEEIISALNKAYLNHKYPYLL